MPSSFTPGPWDFDMGALYAYRVRAKTKRGLWKPVAQVGGFFRDDREANARLIASAPDLLEACKLAVKSWFSGEISEVQMEVVLRAAIAKAEGEDK